MQARIKILLLMCMTCLTLAACSGEGRQALDFLWPDLNDPYVQACTQWSRSASLYDGIETEVSAVATLMSRPWRQAYAHRYADVYGLTQVEEQNFFEDQLKAHEEATTFVLALAGRKRELTRLDKRMKTWRVTAQQGETVRFPLEMRPLRREDWPAERLAAFFPHHTRWQKYYFIRFEPLSEGPVRLLVSGPAGRVAFDWQNYK